MGMMKRCLERRSCELGYGGLINDDVIARTSDADLSRIAVEIRRERSNDPKEPAPAGMSNVNS